MGISGDSHSEKTDFHLGLHLEISLTTHFSPALKTYMIRSVYRPFTKPLSMKLNIQHRLFSCEPTRLCVTVKLAQPLTVAEETVVPVAAVTVLWAVPACTDNTAPTEEAC